MADQSGQKGWEQQSDGILKAVPHFDMEKELLDYKNEKERKRAERAREVQIEKDRELEKKRAEKSLGERSL